MKKKTLIVAFIVLFLDLLSKYLIFGLLDTNLKYTLIKGFFSINPIKNYGAAFSILEDSNILLISISVIILIYLLLMIRKEKDRFLNYLSYGLLIGGLLGNLFDRLFFSYVRDFISFTFFKYDFAIFNIADIGIVVGAIILIFINIFKEK